ncbi:hypothetical protein BN871_AC_00110 [Paenibacillus sp. P22]|nr:hypothetical protein BN871_AC_00110 [Paenibacillus sp. P22]
MGLSRATSPLADRMVRQAGFCLQGDSMPAAHGISRAAVIRMQPQSISYRDALHRLIAGEILADEIGRQLSAQRDHRHAAAGVGRAADEIQPFEHRAAARNLESAVQLPVGDRAVDGAAVRPVQAAQVVGDELLFVDDMTAQAFRAHPLQLVEHEAAIALAMLLPALSLGERRHMRQHEPVLAAFRSLAGIRLGRYSNVDGRIVRRHPVDEHVAEFPLGIAGEEEVVMLERLVAAVHAEQQHMAGYGRLVFDELLGGAPAAGSLRQKGAVRRDRFQIADDEIGLKLFSAGQLHSDRRSVGIEDADDFRSGAHFGSKLVQQLELGLRDSVHAASDEVDAEAHLHVDELGEHGRRRVRGRADIHREKLEDLPQMRMLQVALRNLRHRLHRIHREQLLEGMLLPEIGQTAQGAAVKAFHAEIVLLSRVVEERQEAFTVLRGQLRDAVQHRRQIADKIQHLAVLVYSAPLGLYSLDVDIIMQIASGGGEQSLKRPGHRQDGRSCIEGIPQSGTDIQLAARTLVFLQHRNLMAVSAQPDRCRQSGQAASDDDDVFAHLLFPPWIRDAETVDTG